MEKQKYFAFSPEGELKRISIKRIFRAQYSVPILNRRHLN